MIAFFALEMKDITDTEFLVGQFRVDMLRSQVVAQDNIVAMQPKVLQVLLLLAKNQGEVVSHEEILSTIWPHTQVEPNALQRCIAQLRKVFGDDAKQQRFIATHPKIGYSLVVSVDWPKNASVSRLQPNPPTKNNLQIAALVSVTLLCMIALFVLLPSKSQNDLPLDRMKLLTATDNKEFSPAVSPNGNNLVFLRYIGDCKSQLWGMDLTSGKEFLLNKTAGIYSEPTWSADGSEITYISAQSCDSERESGGCRSVESLPYSLAKASPQQGRVLLQCQNQHFFSPQWINSNELALLVAVDDSVKVALATPDDTQSAQIKTLELDISQPYELVYAQGLNKLIALQKDKQHKVSMSIFDIGNSLTTEVTFDVPENHQTTLSQSAVWHPHNKTLLIGSKGVIFEVDLDGKIVEHPLTNNDEIDGLAVVGENSQIIASIGQLDTDVGYLNWINNNECQSQVFGRSNLEESNAQFQPNGELVAFVSNRTGSTQIWLEHSNNNIEQLTYASDILAGVQSFIWTEDGQALILISQNRLYIKSLTGEIQALQNNLKVHEIYQNLGNNQLLLGADSNGQTQVVQLNLHNNEVIEHYTGKIRWAQLTDDGRLYISEINAKLAKVINKQALPLPVQNSLLSWHKFFYRDEHLVFLDDNRRLSKLNPKTQSHEYIINSPLNIHRVTDINMQQNLLLFSQSISGKREIGLFYR